MALTTVNITGTFNFPDATWSQYAKAEFHISGFDTDTEVVIPKAITSTLGATGALDVDIWGNDDGIRGTVYRVYVVVYDGASYARELIRRDLGLIQISGDGPFDIANLLSVPVTVPEAWYRTITQAEYDAAIAAVAAAEAARDATIAAAATTFNSDAAFIAADLTAYPDGTIVRAEDALHIKVTGALATSAASIKNNWEYVAFPTVAGLIASVQPMTEGDVKRAYDYRYEVAASGATDQHITTAGGVKLYSLADGGYLDASSVISANPLTTLIDGPAKSVRIVGNLQIESKADFSSVSPFHSVWIDGVGSRFVSRVTLNSASDVDYMFQFGDGSFDQFHTGVRHMQIDGNEKVTDAVFYLLRSNFSRFKDIWIEGTNGNTGFKARPGAGGLLQEVSFQDFSVVPSQATQARASISCDIEATGNIDFLHSNFEYCEDGLRFGGDSATPALTFTGGRIERCSGFAFDLFQCQVNILCEVNEGATFLDAGVINSDIKLMGPNAGSFPSNPNMVIDNGFGNRIHQQQSLAAETADQAKAMGIPGHFQKGDEWTRVPDFNLDSMNEDGSAGWVLGGTAVIAETSSPMMIEDHPDAKSIIFRSVAANDYMEREFDVLGASADYLALVGLTFQRPSNNQIKVELIDASSAVLWSETVGGHVVDATNDRKAMSKLIKLGASDYAGATLKVRISGLLADCQCSVWFCGVKQSILKHTSEWSNFDTSSGVGWDKTYRRNLVTTPMTAAAASEIPKGVGTIFRAVVEPTTLGADGASLFGLYGTSNQTKSRALARIPSKLQSREYTCFTNGAASGGSVAVPHFLSFAAGSDTLDVSRAGLYPVYAKTSKTTKQAQLTGPFTTSARANLTMTGFGPLQLHEGHVQLVLNSDNVGTGSNYWIIRLRARLGAGAATDLWTINNQSSTWSAGIPVFEALSEADLLGRNLWDAGYGLEIELTKINAASDLDGSLSAGVVVREYLS